MGLGHHLVTTSVLWHPFHTIPVLFHSRALRTTPVLRTCHVQPPPPKLLWHFSSILCSCASVASYLSAFVLLFLFLCFCFWIPDLVGSVEGPDGREWNFCISVVDLDEKVKADLPRWYKQDQEIYKAYLKYALGIDEDAEGAPAS